MNREVIIQNLMRNISAECQKRSIAPETLFRRCGVNTSIMYNLRKGFLLSVDKIAAIAEYCDVSVDYLIGREFKTNGSG